MRDRLQVTAREPDARLAAFYDALLGVLRLPVVRNGDWRLLECSAAWDGNPTADGFVAFTWSTGDARLVVVVNYAATHETPETKVAAVVDFYGPTDYEKVARQRKDYPARFNMTSINGHQATGGGIWFFQVDGYDDASYAKLRDISPIHAVHKGMPPFLEIHGTRDDQVPYEQSTLMCEAMHKVGAVCDIVTIEAGGHGMGSWKDADQQHYKAEMIAWLKKTLNVR